MNNKPPSTVKYISQLVFQKLLVNYLTTCSRVVAADFKMALHHAASWIWSSAEIGGCRFPPTQFWYRKIQALNLLPTNNCRTEKGTETNKWMHWIFELALLPSSEVSPCFVEDRMIVKPDRHDVTNFCQIFTRIIVFRKE